MSDLVLLNGRLLDPTTGDFLPHGSLAAHGGDIVAVGDESSVRPWISPAATVVDLRGAVITPGLIDGHCHPVSGADLTRGADLSACVDLPGLRAELDRARRALAPGEWLHGWGLDPNLFGDLPISADTVGPVLAGVPAVLRLFDAHSTLASHRALELAGVTGPRRFDEAAEIVCDERGRPTGLLLEEPASMLVEEAAPKPSDEQFRARVAEVLRGMAAAGLTGGHMMEGDRAERAVLRALDERGELPLRLRLAPWCRPGDAVGELIAAQGDGGALWRVAGVKLFLDGTIDNGTAWLEKPDCHGESMHPYWPDPAAYTAAVVAFDAAGVPTATHAIGDAAIRHVLLSLEKSRTIGHRIEHIETLPDDLVPRFAELGVTASMQPTHCCEFTRADHTDNWSRRLGEERAARAWRCRDLWEAGATVVLGSDWPIAPYPPLGVMAGARHRRPARDLSQPPHGLDQALTPLQALRGMTVNAGSGRLAVGERADLTVLADDPLRVSDLDLAALPVRLTVTAGRVTHRAADL
ncbi:putative amidohydrolase YtcJ [Actinoplanes octamycinicus]|uniref:Putative amidohydrolase YtcJ n=1 Tax=Actinoplanes octamycinicus TaxID=135948 RepID=A0A7W7GXL2_9ACTN|nr:amidohydrolase [Actinoplanes octamycinicus]MBB4740174.1 putative amidohydrolase YtcJ [Actinoplanes octamycinicus]GIE59571.1 amidohydrolase [Actinoplanes octamycinicus]